jgi:ankyrin repeat protein
LPQSQSAHYQFIKQLLQHTPPSSHSSLIDRFSLVDILLSNGKWEAADSLATQAHSTQEAFPLAAVTVCLGLRRIKPTSRQRWPLLLTATWMGKTALARSLLDAGLDVDVFDRNLWTPLHVAVLTGNEELVAYYLSRGADAQQGTNHGWTVLHTAAVVGGDRGAASSRLPIAPGSLSSGHPQAESPTPKKQKNRKISARDRREISDERRRAATANILNMLLSSGQFADVNIKDGRGRTPLDLAVAFYNEPAIHLLLQHGGRLHSLRPNKTGWTVLHQAAKRGDYSAMECLVKATRIDALKRDLLLDMPETAHGWTPLMISAKFGHEKIVALLVKNGANLHLTDNTGRNSLHMALERNKRSVVKELMRKADAQVLTAKTIDGYTPSDMASTRTTKNRQSLKAIITRNKKPLEQRCSERSRKRRQNLRISNLDELIDELTPLSPSEDEGILSEGDHDEVFCSEIASFEAESEKRSPLACPYCNEELGSDAQLKHHLLVFHAEDM